MRRLSLLIPSMSFASSLVNFGRPAGASSTTGRIHPLTRRSSGHLSDSASSSSACNTSSSSGSASSAGTVLAPRQPPLLERRRFHGLLVEGHLDGAPARHLGRVFLDHCCGATNSPLRLLWAASIPRRARAARRRGSVGAGRGAMWFLSVARAAPTPAALDWRCLITARAQPAGLRGRRAGRSRGRLSRKSATPG